MSPRTAIELENKWDDGVAAAMSEPELLKYRSNLLGSDLRITNFVTRPRLLIHLLC